MASGDEAAVITSVGNGAGISQAMSTNNKVIMKAASKDRDDMPMAINDEVPTPMIPEMDGNQMPP